MRVGQPEAVEVWEEGTYPATLVDVVETVSSPIYGSKPRLRHVFRVWGGGRHDEGDYADVWYFTGATLSRHPSAALRPLVEILRPELKLDDPELDLEIGHPEGEPASEQDALIGARCRVILGINAEKGRNVVEKVLAAEGRRAVPRAAPQRQPVAAGAAEDDAPGF